MLEIGLVFWESEPQYAYKRYAYKKKEVFCAMCQLIQCITLYFVHFVPCTTVSCTILYCVSVSFLHLGTSIFSLFVFS